MSKVAFEWDDAKDRENRSKHGVGFAEAQHAFADPMRIIAQDLSHSQRENRFYCFGKTGGGIMTVRFTYRNNMIRIIGAGYWRKGKKLYEEHNIHK
ncbi:MAG: BrnT family toxin [Kiritimatiellae bacterium]|nr:BrnT family toxin [Kiritimatiellia bacterium]MDD5522550.1 BrnT family toxin [Kiritimatiellia bacterium]